MGFLVLSTPLEVNYLKASMSEWRRFIYFVDALRVLRLFYIFFYKHGC